MNPLVGMAVVLVALGALLLVVKRVQGCGRLSPEGARKCVHMGMGVICLSFPWLFATPWPVWGLALLSVLGLGALRAVPLLRRELGGVLHDVQRVSLGEIYFPLGVALVFNLAQGSALVFSVPVALLTFADAAGALVGKRWGCHGYETLVGRKSLEGSLAVGLIGWLCVSLPLLIAGYDWRVSVVIGALIGLFGMMVEAISWRGLDNIFLPLAALAQIKLYLSMSTGTLVARLAVLMVITVAAWVWRRGRVVDDCARLGGALALYFVWAVGGWMWLVAPVILLASYMRIMPAIPGGIPRHNLVAVICVGGAGVATAVAQASAPFVGWLWCFTLAITTQHAVIAVVRFSQARPHWSRTGCGVAGTVQALALQGVAFVVMDQGQTVSGAQLAGGLVCLVLAIACFIACEPKLADPDELSIRWWKQGIASLLAAALGTSSLLFL